MTTQFSPPRWANELTILLNKVYGNGPERFPVNVERLAKEYSRQRYPDDPVTLVRGDSLPGFDGALYRAPARGKGWGIIYNKDVMSPGRINFTLAHEFGHYLLHRQWHPDGSQCSQQDMVRWNSAHGRIEQQANVFAARLLMPFDDFRQQIKPQAKPTLEDIGECAERYQVSLIAATLRWLEYTERRSVLVISRDGFILWSRSSSRALRTGAFFRTSGRPPVAIPEVSLPMQADCLNNGRGVVTHDSDIWLPEPCEEIVLLSGRYDFAISLLHLDDIDTHYKFTEELEEEDSSSYMPNRNPE